MTAKASFEGGTSAVFGLQPAQLFELQQKQATSLARIFDLQPSDFQPREKAVPAKAQVRAQASSGLPEAGRETVPVSGTLTEAQEEPRRKLY